VGVKCRTGVECHVYTKFMMICHILQRMHFVKVYLDSGPIVLVTYLPSFVLASVPVPVVAYVLALIETSLPH